ncbi:anti-phage-associated DUF499 domain-containing protein [Candidatus Chloroploca asiatica]|uniref:Uncharacterized protein n=1 Tax=Candidatus Chloroploca asiatica TaxID=1506545 RepID=A0A2H3KGM6_9CHLR|nr:anti-phage-associated DUF499 domain-containing protein [Candidatus Chloroploca asiatica]PDV96873.1 hypothetical protein A9Q02_20045 [Candidatus Chloroploca asiatica]
MKTVRDACQLQPNALMIKLSDQIEQLDELIAVEGDGEAFFARTFITQGMRDLIDEGIARLAGASTQAVFHLKQAMGGGKTHLLVGFGLLAQSIALRRRYCGGNRHGESFATAQVAAFNGRNNPDHYFWGEIANQLGSGEQFKAFWMHGPKAPDERDWLQLFAGDQPTLILLDEMPPYFHYLDTQKVGNGTVADIATRAFANLLTAAGKKKNVCVVVSDLAAAYDTGAKLIYRALEDARAELGRQERTITPVDLAANEIYDILRKRLFTVLPDQAEIDDIAAAFGRKLEEAARSKTASRGAEAIADEIAATYPFHPRLKNVIALFKENEQFKQTRGLIELVSRLLRSVWERQANDVFLIGPQHFDLAIPDVRDKLTEISGMRDVIAKDLWDAQQSAHAQVIDLQTGKEAATQVSALLLTASLSTAVNAVKGLTREELVECLVSPLREPSEFLAAFDQIDQVAWYLHHTPEGRYYFDRQENLTKLLQSLAHDAPENQVDDLIRHRLREMFKPSRKICYDEVLPLPRLDEVADRVRKGRVLLIISPDAKMPSDEIQRFFEGLSQKNNLCVLTGDKTAMGSIEKAARQFFAAQKADGRIPKGHPQRDDLERKQQAYEQDFNATILNLFDKVLFPIQRAGRPAQLVSKPLDMTRDASRPFNGEEQIEKTLVANPLKLYLDVDQEFEAIRDKAQDLLWPLGQDETRWSDAVDRYAEQPGMPWLPPRGLDTLKSLACNRGLWEDLGNGYVTKKPKKKRTSVQVIPESTPDDAGKVRLRINPQHAGPAPRIFYAEDGPVNEKSALLHDAIYTTNALRVNFLVCDPSGQYETGDPVSWSNKLVLRSELSAQGGHRRVALFVAPRGTIRYTLDGSEPRDGTAYAEPIAIGDGEVILRAFAEADGLETKHDFRFPARGISGPQIDALKPGQIVSRTGRKLDSRAKTFEGLKQAGEKSATFEGVVLTVGQGNQMIAVQVGEIAVSAAFIEALLLKVLEMFTPDTPITLTFRKAHFASGHDLKDFAEKLGLVLQAEDVQQ